MKPLSRRYSPPRTPNSVKSRLDSSSGISFTEFSYQLLQAYDFLRLHRDLGCTMQLGGSDQLGNIVSGIDLIRRSNHVAEAAAKGVAAEAEEGAATKEDPAFGLTFPLLTTATGEKFGKSAGNAIWLDARMTSPFDVYQVSLIYLCARGSGSTDDDTSSSSCGPPTRKSKSTCASSPLSVSSSWRVSCKITRWAPDSGRRKRSPLTGLAFTGKPESADSAKDPRCRSDRAHPWRCVDGIVLDCRPRL